MGMLADFFAGFHKFRQHKDFVTVFIIAEDGRQGTFAGYHIFSRKPGQGQGADVSDTLLAFAGVILVQKAANVLVEEELFHDVNETELAVAQAVVNLAFRDNGLDGIQRGRRIAKALLCL